jgi:hypothetical protein
LFESIIEDSFVFKKIACTTATRSILLGKLLGLENVNNSYSFMLVFHGVATVIGIPLAGIYAIIKFSFLDFSS